jgi:hypothetical protein
LEQITYYLRYATKKMSVELGVATTSHILALSLLFL